MRLNIPFKRVIRLRGMIDYTRLIVKEEENVC